MKKLLAPISIAVALASSFAACTRGEDACTQGESTYPQAEWDYAKAILMHTPGEELFDGVAHPYAGLFEYYFDVDKAAEEHQGYMDALERNGIAVYTVHELLGQVPMEKLRDCARRALTYDTSALPDSATAENEAYRQSIIGQMSRANLIRCILLRPTVKLSPTALPTIARPKGESSDSLYSMGFAS